MIIKIKNLCISIFSIVLIISCQTNKEVIEEFTEPVINENIKFEEFLSRQWDKDLEDSPIFASLLGNKKFNQDVSSNSIKSFENKKLKFKKSLSKLNSFDYEQLNPDNQLNYQLKEISLKNSIEASNYPSYYMGLNQRGGVQSYYETGDRLVYESKQDYEDWLVRLSKYVDNIINTKNNLEEGLKNGYTQPRLITEQVIAQVDNILNSDLNNNPYLKIFINADNSFFNNGEKEDLINRARELIKINIIPAYIELNNFLKTTYLPNSRESIGLNDIPNGSSWYEYAARYHTTTNLTPDEIHNIGLKEVARIRNEMEQIINDLEWDGDFKSI